AVGFTFFPSLMELQAEQLTPLVLFGLVGFLQLEKRGRLVWAGAAAAVLALKPHLLYLFWGGLPLWVLHGRRLRGGARLRLGGVHRLVAQPGGLSSILSGDARLPAGRLPPSHPRYPAAPAAGRGVPLASVCARAIRDRLGGLPLVEAPTYVGLGRADAGAGCRVPFDRGVSLGL